MKGAKIVDEVDVHPISLVLFEFLYLGLTSVDKLETTDSSNRDVVMVGFLKLQSKGNMAKHDFSVCNTSWQRQTSG